MSVADILTRIIGYFAVPAIGTLILFRHEKGLFSSFLKGFLVYLAETAVVRLFMAYPVYKAWSFIGRTLKDGDKRYALFALVSAVFLSYLFVLLRKYFAVKLTAQPKEKANEKE